MVPYFLLDPICTCKTLIQSMANSSLNLEQWLENSQHSYKAAKDFQILEVLQMYHFSLCSWIWAPDEISLFRDAYTNSHHTGNCLIKYESPFWRTSSRRMLFNPLSQYISGYPDILSILNTTPCFEHPRYVCAETLARPIFVFYDRRKWTHFGQNCSVIVKWPWFLTSHLNEWLPYSGYYMINILPFCKHRWRSITSAKILYYFNEIFQLYYLPVQQWRMFENGYSDN